MSNNIPFPSRIARIPAKCFPSSKQVSADRVKSIILQIVCICGTQEGIINPISVERLSYYMNLSNRTIIAALKEAVNFGIFYQLKRGCRQTGAGQYMLIEAKLQELESFKHADTAPLWGKDVNNSHSKHADTAHIDLKGDDTAPLTVEKTVDNSCIISKHADTSSKHADTAPHQCINSVFIKDINLQNAREAEASFQKNPSYIETAEQPKKYKPSFSHSAAFSKKYEAATAKRDELIEKVEIREQQEAIAEETGLLWNQLYAAIEQTKKQETHAPRFAGVATLGRAMNKITKQYGVRIDTPMPDNAKYQLKAKISQADIPEECKAIMHELADLNLELAKKFERWQFIKTSFGQWGIELDEFELGFYSQKFLTDFSRVNLCLMRKLN